MAGTISMGARREVLPAGHILRAGELHNEGLVERRNGGEVEAVQALQGREPRGPRSHPLSAAPGRAGADRVNIPRQSRGLGWPAVPSSSDPLDPAELERLVREHGPAHANPVKNPWLRLRNVLIALVLVRNPASSSHVDKLIRSTKRVEYSGVRDVSGTRGFLIRYLNAACVVNAGLDHAVRSGTTSRHGPRGLLARRRLEAHFEGFDRLRPDLAHGSGGPLASRTREKSRIAAGARDLVGPSGNLWLTF